MRKRRTRYSERNTRYHSRKGQTFQQIILSIVALFLVVIFLVVLCTDPMGNNGSVPPESVMAAKDADETADSNVSQSDESVSDTRSNRQYRFKFRLAAAPGEQYPSDC